MWLIGEILSIKLKIQESPAVRSPKQLCALAAKKCVFGKKRYVYGRINLKPRHGFYKQRFETDKPRHGTAIPRHETENGRGEKDVTAGTLPFIVHDCAEKRSGDRFSAQKIKV